MVQLSYVLQALWSSFDNESCENAFWGDATSAEHSEFNAGFESVGRSIIY